MKAFVRSLFAICGLLGLSNVVFAAIPTLSYTTPNTYTVGAAIPTLAPTLGGGAVSAFGYGAGTAFTGGNLGQPWDMDIDGAGNVYVADYSNQRIREFNAAGASIGNFGTGIPGAAAYAPVAVAFDAAGNAYVLDDGNNRLIKLNSAGAYQSILVTGITTPRGLAIDASGNIYVTDANVPSVKKYNSAGTLLLTITANLNNPDEVAIDPISGNIYVANRGGNNVLLYNSSGTYVGIFKAGFTGPYSVTTDAVGNVYVANTGGNIVDVYNSAGTLLGTRAVSGGVRGIVIDVAGDLIASDINAATVTKYPPNGGFYLTTGTLPAGLSFDSSTGKITGTPTATFGPSNFQVTAYNASGKGVSNTFTIQCVVAAPSITYTTPVTMVVGTPVTLTPTNSGGAITSASVAPALPAGLTISATGVISGTPTTVTAANNYVVTANNAGGSGTFTINITVNPKLPAITYTSPNVYTTGVAITPLNPNSTGGAVASYAVSPALPAGLSIDPLTGIISGTPTGTATIATYTVTATNVTGNGTFGISITVNPPKPVITYSTPQTYVVGTAIATLSATNTGGPITSFSVAPALPAGLNLNTITGDITGTPTAQSVAANYVVTATNAGGNGTFTINITVLPMPPVISYTTPNVFVVGTAYTLNPTSSGGPVVSYSVSPALPGGLNLNTTTGVISGTPTTVTPATDYVVTATNANSSTTFTVNITVNNPPVPIFTYTNPAAITYGGTVSVTPANSGGIPTSCTISPTGTGITVSASGVVSGTPNAAGTTTYTITPSNSGGTGPAATVTITVNQAVLTVTANNQTKVYGAAIPTLTFAYSGFVNGDTQASLTTGATVTTTATVSSPVSPPTYPITASGVVDPNYTFNYVAGALTITKAALTVKANAQTKVYGTAFTFAGTEFTTTGLQPGDAVTSATFASPGAAATATVAGSPYTITPSAAVGTGLSNYTITYTTNTFTVTKATLTVTANNQTKVYGNTFTFAGTEFTVGAGQLKNTDNVTGATISSTGAVATATVAGSPYPILISAATGTGLANYTIGYVNGSMTVTPAALTITAVSQTRDVGIVTALTLSYAGFQNGETSADLTTQATETTTATVTSPVGTYPITASGAVDPNYTISYVAGVLTITASGTHTYTWDWTAASNTTWENPLNWQINGVQQTTNYPGSATNKDIADIGVNVFYTSTKSPFIAAATISVTSINFGTDHAAQIGLVVNGTLTTSSDITLTVDNNIFGSALTVNLSGTGTINVPNLNLVNNETALAFENSGINSSVANLNVSGNISLTTSAFIFANIGSKFTVTGGTTTVGGQLKTSNNAVIFAATTSTFSVNPATTATLILTNANAINLDNNTSVLDFDHAGSTVNYNGAAASQTVYTSATANASTGANYRNLTISGSGNGVPQTGTLTVNQDMLTSGKTNFGTNAPTVNVAGTWTNTSNVTQGAAIITTTALTPASGLITGGSGTLTAGSMHFTGGNLTASNGTITCTGTYLNDGGTFDCGTAANASVVFKGAYTNNSGTLTANPASTSSVFFSGSNQTLTDNTTAGTLFNNVTFNGTNTAMHVGTGNFGVAATGTLTMGTGTQLTAGSGAVNVGYLTLLSNASSTASVAAMPTGASIVGAVNVQRFITGGAGTRGYRLLTSPVNISGNASGGGNLSLAYLNTNASFGGTTYLGSFTEGPGTGFTYNGSFNPIIYLYDESRPSTNQGFTAGKNIGIYSIFATTVTTLTGTTQGAAAIPVGNSYLLYYVGDNHDATQGAVVSTRIPESIAITATGYINQGSVPVKFWNTNSTNIPYDVTTGTSYPGLNQVGNPYPSTISLDVVATDNAAVNKVFWELVPGGSYVSYNASNHAVSDARASKYILSGQGFLVEAQATGETLTFKETEKVAYPSGFASPFNTASSAALLMDIKTRPNINNSDVVSSGNGNVLASADRSFQAILPPTTELTGLHLQLTKDSLNFVQTGVYFGTGNNDKFAQNEDAVSVNGSGAQVFLSSYSADNVNVGINQLGDYSIGKRVRLYAGVTSSGAYTIALADIANIDTINYNVFLIDHKMNDSVDMIQNKSYAFNINNADTSTWGANRFVLVIEHKGVPQYVLNSFTGKKVAAGVLLTWLTTNASDYTGYVLQKQGSDGSYHDLYSAQSDKGEIKYSYIDQNPVIGNNTYRLEQNDVYGKITYSSPITIVYNKGALAKAGLSIFPNPSNSIVNIIYTDRANPDPSPNYTVDIFNAAGTFIKHESINSNAWTEDISAYKLGVYLLQLKDSTGQLIGQTKFIKNL